MRDVLNFHKMASIAEFHSRVYSDIDLNMINDVRREIEGDTCEECGDVIAQDSTPSWIFKSKDFCECDGNRNTAS